MKTIYKKTCIYEGCKKEFETTNPRKFYCSDSCQRKAYYVRKTGRNISALKIIKCDNCGKEFKQRILGQRFCCYDCKIKKYVHERAEYNRQLRIKNKKKQIKIKINNLNDRAVAQKQTGVSAGYLEAFKNYPEILTRLIAYKKEINYKAVSL